MLAPGQAFGRYVVEELLGSGGMGHVYRAHDTVLHRHVALKVLVVPHGDPAQWEEAKARLLREARAAAALQHPGAVAIYDLGTIGDTPFIAMELVPGQSLRAFVGDALVPWDRKLRWMLDVASTLGAAHAAGLVHRDIKPENVMVRPDGQVKVLDFGIARRSTPAAGEPGAAPAAPSTQITGAGTVLGTPRYMPPEQLAGRPLDGRADEFAWAVTTYELLSGSAPWPESTDIIAAATAILTAPAPPLLTVAPELPLAVSQVIDRALSKRPDDRYATMEDLVAELEPHAAPFVPPALASNPAVSARPSGPRPIDPYARTQARPETAKGVSADRAQPTHRRAKRRSMGLPVALVAVVLVGGAALAVRMRAASGPAPAPSAPPSASALALTDLPRPTSSDPAALTAYATGLQAARDANGDLARVQLLQAATKDPSMAAAHLRFALQAFFPASDVPRKHFAQAVQLRSTLSPYDQALLDAVEPIFDRQPPDWAGTEKRLAEATRRISNDAELFEILAWVRSQLADLPGVAQATDGALAIDPRYAAAWHEKAVAAVSAGDWKTVEQAADRCLEVAPQATSCVRMRMYGEAREDRCADYEQDARRIIAIDPETPEGYQRMASASFVLGRPADAVWEALAQSWKRQTGDDAAWNENNDRFNLAGLLGDAAKQDEGLRGMSKFAKDRPEALYHLIPAWGGVLVLTEAGQLDRAAALASDFLGREPAWRVDPGIDSFSVSFDMQPFMLKALLRAGKIAPADFESRRQAWIDSWKPRLSATVARYLWVYGYATTVDTAEDAAQALAVLPQYSPLPEFRPSLLADADVGHVLLLGGRLDEAIPILKSAAGDCDAFENGIEWVKASLWLGQALEQKGDTAGACAAYANVVKRWGPLGKRSTSAALAGKRLVALSCGMK